MWNPLAALPASNAGALSAYQPQQPAAPQQPAVQPNPVPVPPTGLHPLYGGGGHGFLQGPMDRIGGMMGGPGAGGMADQNAWRTTMQAWHGDRPDGGGPDKFDPRAAMAAAQAAGTPWDRQAAQQQWQTDVQMPWQQGFMDWRQARPMRSDF